MAEEFRLPDVGEGVAEGELVNWLVEPGDTVTEDQAVAEVETDKAVVDVPSPFDGTVRELHWAEGDVVPVGDVLITFNVEGVDDLDETVSAGESDATSAEADAEAEPATTADSGSAAEAAEVDGEVSTAEGRVFAPPSARRLARELGVEITAVEGTGPSGRITEQDVRAAAEAEPAGDASEPAEAATATAGEGAADAAATGSTETTTSSTTSAGSAAGTAGGQVESADRDKTLAAPATRRIAEEEDVDLNAVPATEQRDGEAFVTPEAVREYAQAQQRAQEADAEALAAGSEADRPREEREPFRGVRKTIADAMVESKYSAPHVTHHDEVDVTELVETRDELKEVAEDRGIRLTYMPFIMKAVVAALKQFPEMNAVIDEDNEEIVHRNYYNIGVATATDVGLMVPVVDNADGKGMLQLSSEMNELVQKARERSISPDELQGSTFTITNIGGIGGEYATPILNYPESGILAVGEIKKKPRVVTDSETGEESIEPRHVMTLSLSFDHRLIDGAVGAQFTNAVMEYLENPDLLLLE
jgi:pyruvate dehydrogenase E2 component (dihydrolipoamide acetyltransferase)